MKKLLLFLTVFFSAALLHGKIIYVNKTATGANNGTSWFDAFTELSTALPAAQYGDEIWVAKGRYLPYIPFVAVSFHLVSGTKLLGGFDGTETQADQRDWTANETILTGLVDSVPFIVRLSNVVYCENTDSTTLIDGFTIRDGLAALFQGENCEDFLPNYYACHGGGIYLFNNAPSTPTFLTVRNCRIVDNGAWFGGGIAANFALGSGGLKVHQCHFERNGCSEQGGAVYLIAGPEPQNAVWIDSCVFQKNYGWVSTGISIEVFSDSLDLQILNSHFIENKASESCSSVAIENYGMHKSRVFNCAFQSNQAGSNPAGGGRGGAILGFNYRVENCIFLKNVANFGGAAAIGGVDIVNCLFAGNHSRREGGALRNSSDVKIVNSVFYNNTSEKTGGAIRFLSGKRDTIINCIFSNNKAVEGGDVIASGGGGKIHFDYTSLDINDCLELAEDLNPQYDTLTCGDNMYFNLDPLFRDTANGDFRLKGCSPLLNLGDSTWAARFGLLKDLDGNPRILDGAPDLGAYETPVFSLQLTADVQDASGPQNPDGSIAVTAIDGGTSPYFYEWDSGALGDAIDSLLPSFYLLTVTDQEDCTVIWTFEVKYTSGVDDAENFAHLLIYPNPASHLVNLEASNLKSLTPAWLDLFNATGQKVKSFDILQKAENSKWQIPLNGLASGNYVVCLRSAAGEIIGSGRFVKQ